jgi:hypothetical protein
MGILFLVSLFDYSFSVTRTTASYIATSERMIDE